MKYKHSQLIILFLLIFSSLLASELNLKLKGDSASGFYVDVFYGSIPVSTMEKSGELNLVIENEDRSIRETINSWKATMAFQNSNAIILKGIARLPKLEADIAITVTYEIVNHQVVEKRMEFIQTNLSMLYFSVNSSLSSSTPPSRFWSFDNADNKGGVAHESYPAAGYMIGDSLCVGLLTDAGNRNLWTRNIRRRPSAGGVGFRAIQEICDANLYRIASTAERNKGDNYVRLTFGDLSDFNHPIDKVSCKTPELKDWKSYNGAEVHSEKGITILKGK